MLPFDAWIALTVTALVFVGLQLRRNAPPDVLFLGGLVAVTVTGVITPEEALEGFSNPAPLTIAGLLAVAAGLRTTGVLDWVGNTLLGTAHTERSALRRLTVTLVAASAVVLNTALVAMMLPVVVDWCRKRSISPSRLLIPLSYLTILGGVCTLIGTSTTLVVNGKLEQYANEVPMELLEIGQVGLPCAVVGTLVLLLFGKYLLPDRTNIIERLGDARREYLVEMMVQGNCSLIGKTVEEAGLRQLPGLFLIEIDRQNELITPVTPQDVIHGGDRLVFTGIVETIVDLEKIPGLVPAADLNYEFHPERRLNRKLTEVVLSRTSPLIGSTVRDANFRQRYNAAVLAVHRNGVRLTNKIGDIELETGDTLLLQTRSEFVPTYRNSRDFYLVSSVEGDSPRRHDRAIPAALLAITLVIWLSIASFSFVRDGFPYLASPAVAAIAIAGLMIVTRCMRAVEARSAIDIQLLLTIVGALGLGTALQESGAAEQIAKGLILAVGDNPMLLLIVVYLVTVVFTEMITNNAVAATLLPLAIEVAREGGYHTRPFVMAIALAASLSFITPIGYQTNLMVMGPGGYRPRDFLRAGIPVAISVACVALLLIPQIWPFY